MTTPLHPIDLWCPICGALEETICTFGTGHAVVQVDGRDYHEARVLACKAALAGNFGRSSFDSRVEFVECDTCRVKSGAPRLCYGCLRNRELVRHLGMEVAMLEEFLHGHRLHPFYEYATTQEHTPDGEGWERNAHVVDVRFLGRDTQSYWMRKRLAKRATEATTS